MPERTGTCRACGRPIQLRAVIVPPEAMQTIRREDAIRSLEAAAEVARTGGEGQ